MTPDIWHAKKVVDSTLHPGENSEAKVPSLWFWANMERGHVADTGEPVFYPFRMSAFVLSNLVVTAGMLTPGLGVRCFLTSQCPVEKKVVDDFANR